MNLLEGVLWLALNVYHEARSEPDEGQIAVVLVTLNRSRKKNKPVKEVVLEPFQFSWTTKNNVLPDDWGAFIKCLKIVTIAVQHEDITDGAMWYHHERATPYWADDYTYVAQYGVHKFYKP